MKKIIITVLALIMLIVSVSCSSKNGSLSTVSTENKDADTYLNESQSYETEEKKNSDSGGEIGDTAPGYFSNLTDFYKFATTGSRKSSDYSDEYTSRNIGWYPNVSPTALIKFESLLEDEQAADRLEKIHILHTDNKYEYEFKDGSYIRIEQGVNAKSVKELSEYISVNRPLEKCIIENSETKYTTEVSETTTFIKETDGVVVQRMVEKSKYMGFVDFSTIIDGFQITVCANWGSEYNSFDDYLKDPDNQYIAAFYDDAQLSDVVAHLKEVISNRAAAID